MSSIVLLFVTISVTISLVVSIILCICRNKSKSNSVANNVNNLLPLNSIRSSDLQTNQLELIRYNCVNNVSTDETDHHRPHTQRALPDIPSMANTSQYMTSNEFDLNRDIIQTNEIPHNLEVKCRPLKARAPQPPTHPVMTCPTIPMSDDLHHSYARIKDNAIVDSSENETDDYCDPHFCTTSARNMIHDSDDMSPPVPTKRFVNETNSELPFRSSTSRAAEDLGFIGGPVLLNHSNIDTYSHSSNEENRMNTNGTEISYNTISVREPLAKVLAERANTEHHYNEVEEERVSSFYEEIAGSTASSVTYSKIGDILSNNLPQNSRNSAQETQTIAPNGGPVMHSFSLDTTDSVTTQPKQLFMTTITPKYDSFPVSNDSKDLYSSVDKKMKSKSYNRQTIHCIPDSDNEFDNLYAKVLKVNNRTKEDTVFPNQRPSSVSEIEPKNENNIPPPLPPPLKAHQSNHSRSARTISLYDSYSVPKPNTSSHQRRYSSGNQNITTNDWQKRDLNEDVFDYGTVGTNEMDLESDPGYEVIHKKQMVSDKSSVPTASPLVNGFHSESVTDPGYEAIRYDESDFDPNYEVITKKVNTNRQMNETVDPEYEVIKRVPQIQTNTFRFEINRNVSDVSSEPGYERIRFTQNTIQQIESEPNYASISRNQHFYDDEEEEQTLSERL